MNQGTTFTYARRTNNCQFNPLGTPALMEKYACTFATGSRNSVNPSEKSDNLCVASERAVRQGGTGKEEEEGENKPRPNLLPSDFTALREGGRRRRRRAAFM